MVEDKQTKWQSAVDKCDHLTGISHLWRLGKGLSGKQPHNSPIKGVLFADKTYLDPKMIVNKFTHQFTPPPKRLTGDKSKIQLKRQFHQQPLTGTPSFTPADTKEAIRLSKSSTAIGPDGMSTLHLKKLVQRPINCLTNIFNLSISTGQIPEIWHKAIIISILKPGKDNIGINWRPISLLCPAAKTLEKLLLPKILTHIPFDPAQHGPQPKHSTCTALSTINADIAAGSPSSARHARSDSCIRQCGPSTTARLCLQHQHTGNIPSLAPQYMQNRRAKVHFRQNLKSKSRKVKNRSGTRSSVSSALQLPSGRLSNTASEHQADQVRR